MVLFERDPDCENCRGVGRVWVTDDPYPMWAGCDCEKDDER